jgi:hypothetical protein
MGGGHYAGEHIREEARHRILVVSDEYEEELHPRDPHGKWTAGGDIPGTISGHISGDLAWVDMIEVWAVAITRASIYGRKLVIASYSG